MGLKKKRDFINILVNIQLYPYQVTPPVKIMPRPFFYERGITCDKVPLAKMITVKDVIVISHSYRGFFNSKWRYLQRTLNCIPNGYSVIHPKYSCYSV